jgi:hypothetical protein
MKTNEPSLESLDQMANATAAGLTRAAAGSAFDLFRDKQFCRLGVDFCHHQICRGDTEGQDNLFKLTLRSLSRIYVELRVRFEGGRITTLTRMRVALKQMLRRVGRR